MATSIYEVKNKIRSIRTIEKITRAMKLVATAKLKKSQKSLRQKHDYFEITREIVSTFMLNDKINIFAKIFASHKNNKSVLYVLINSELGFCGSFNSGINKLFLNEFNKANDHVITFGKKSLSLLKKAEITPLHSFDCISDVLHFDEIIIPAALIHKEFWTRKCSKIIICYNDFINSINIKPSLLTVWPINKDDKLIQNTLLKNDDGKDKEFIPVIFEPSEEEVAQEVFIKYLNIILYGTLINSKVSENAMRRSSMEKATDNANEIIDDLVLKSNRIRQAIITQEILEIVSGAEN